MNEDWLKFYEFIGIVAKVDIRIAMYLRNCMLEGTLYKPVWSLDTCVLWDSHPILTRDEWIKLTNKVKKLYDPYYGC